jgi:predicted MFS family arabinose efflux permease
VHPLRDRRFRALVVGQAVNGIGSWCALVAIWGYAAERFDAEPWQVAVLGLTWTVPGAILGPLAGVPTDRLDPRRVLIGADLAAAVIALAMAASTTYWSLVVFSALQGFAKSFAQPAFGALAPRIVADDQLARANALLSTSMQVSIAVGPLLGAAAISASGARGAFLIDALTYLIGVAVTVPLQLRPIDRIESGSAWSQAREGLRVVRARPEVVRLFAVGTGVYVLWGSGVTLEPLYVKDVLHRSPATFALLQTIFGIAMVVFGLVVGRMGEATANVRVLAAGSIASGAAVMVYLATRHLGVAFAGIALWGVATPFFVTPMRTLLQRATPPETHGRVFAVDETLRNIGMAAATGTAGLAFGAFGARASGILYGSIALVGGVVALASAGVFARVVQSGPGAEYAPGVDPGAMAVLPGDL